ncbi:MULTISPECIES: hydrogenase 4 membrane subunit [unclassified Campylobacter]|uniref:hydrogenase 4 membrane subunit n=1 Tax=unclassified Campylobacter TaxID=2593542 RepID=UPI0022E9F585|nr:MULTISPECIES: hydrogenase 4 membrane subunit [unclassified Campylobacter]MDA3079352.1 hydrogenase 4 membrane subunit [Campylobacter sp. CS_NA2]MDA3081215.1 hydrogenase 4 membrane subunit [Campylobacter sp. CS_NA1]MDA3085766.1 hydrogenase 4 membrane subunit [Campylobacter sp. CS_ED1]MDA3090186.1 hydrogenase 4 membrane subunit [Campylobacter sp. CS_ED2]WBR51028.1 hydrogenase 4 membrane subunit [Campylobacter sp. CS_NA3]
MEVFAILLMMISLAVFSFRDYKISISLYALNTVCLVTLFFIMAAKFDAHELRSWAVIAIITKVILVPAILFYALSKIDMRYENDPYTGFFLSPVIAFAFSLGLALLLTPIFMKFAIIQNEVVICAAIFTFWIGVCGFILRRSFLKQILAYCLIENAVHLNLATNACNASSLVELGILSDAVFGIAIMAILAVRYKEVFGSQNTNLASELKG